MQVRSGKFRVNGTTLYARVTGSGRPVILLHGWMGTSYHWRKVVPLLADRYQLVAVDARGYGESDKPPGGYDGETIAEDLRQLIAALGLVRPVVVGHDMGALPALLLTARHPDLVRGLVYVDEPLPGYNLDRFTAFSRDNPFVYWWFAFNAQPSLPALMWSGREEELVDYFLTAMSADPASVDRAAVMEYARCLRKPGGLDGSFGWYRDALTTAEQIRAATVRRMKTPVLAVNGAFGHPGVAEQMALVATDVEGVTLPDCGHLCAEEQPEAFAAALSRFLERLPD